MDEEKHFPPGAEPETPATEKQPTPETPEADPQTPEIKPEGETPDAPEKGEGDKPEEGEEPNKLPKKRSIYDDLKDQKGKTKDANARAEAAEAKATELQALLDAKNDAETPEERADADADIAAYAKATGVTPESVEELFKLFESKMPKQEAPQGMSPEELADWRADRARAKQSAEDADIRAQSSSVKKELGISDDAELQSVMDQVVKLAHTEAFHDKEVEYIVWKNRDSLAKLVSPKKPSFEMAGQPGEADGDGDIEFSGKTTPEAAGRALYQGRSKGSGVEIRSAK